MSTPDNHRDWKRQIPEVTSFTLPPPDEIWGLSWCKNTRSSHVHGMKNKGRVFLFLFKQKENINSRPKFCFLHGTLSQNTLLVLYFVDVKTHTLPLFCHLWTGRAPSHQGCLPVTGTRLASPEHTRVVVHVHTVNWAHAYWAFTPCLKDYIIFW